MWLLLQHLAPFWWCISYSAALKMTVPIHALSPPASSPFFNWSSIREKHCIFIFSAPKHLAQCLVYIIRCPVNFYRKNELKGAIRSILGGSSHWRDGFKEEKPVPHVARNCAPSPGRWSSQRTRGPLGLTSLPCSLHLSELLVPVFAVFSCFAQPHFLSKRGLLWSHETLSSL